MPGFQCVITSAQSMSSDRSAKAISGSIIQNSAKCLEVLLFSALNVGPVQSISGLLKSHLTFCCPLGFWQAIVIKLFSVILLLSANV